MFVGTARQDRRGATTLRREARGESGPGPNREFAAAQRYVSYCCKKILRIQASNFESKLGASPSGVRKDICCPCHNLRGLFELFQ
jgi:hypothetical protein